MYNDKEVTNPYVFSITISNTGDYAIENEDFKKEFSINFTGSDGIIKASIIEAHNKDVWNEILGNYSINGSELVFSDFFLNPGESFTMSIITNQNPSGIKYNSRIEGVPNLTLINTRAERIEELKNNRTIFITVMFSVVLVVIIGVVVFLIIDARRYKKYKSKYCIVYYDESHAPTTRKSGTKIALDYAIKKGRKIIAFPACEITDRESKDLFVLNFERH